MMRTTGFLKRWVVLIFGASVFALALLPLRQEAIAQQQQTVSTIADIAQEVDHVVWARHIKTYTVEEADVGYIWTQFDFEVVEQVKGNLPERRFTSGRVGGKFEGRELAVFDGPPMPVFEPGEELVLFLRGWNLLKQPNLYYSRLRVHKGADGDRYVVVPEDWPLGMTLHHSADSRAYERVPGRVPMEDFLFSLRREISR